MHGGPLVMRGGPLVMMPAPSCPCRMQAMGAYGAAALLKEVAARGKSIPSSGLRVLTHCNTGSLATAGFGTALGVIRTLHKMGRLVHAFCTETRPCNLGKECEQMCGGMK